MNATSSRAHTVVTITFDQFIKTVSGERKKSSILNLVDLAGSERADSSGATGDRLKEGANINKSLSALGNVISALADLPGGKKKIVIPYRDSVLTKLLQNALGGNSKTIMIASLSPADINYDESLSTLRYADRAKRIKNKAFINENPIDKLIHELQQENEKLKKIIQSGNISQRTDDSKRKTAEEMEKMRNEILEEAEAQLLTNQERLAATEGKGPSWEEKLNVARAESSVQNNHEERKSSPHLKNINEDPMLSGVVFHFLQSGETAIGRKDAKPVPNICFSGISIMKYHAIITRKDGEIEIKTASPGARTRVNGVPLIGPKLLGHKDRILFGSSHLYLFVNPLKAGKTADLPIDITWEFAQKEIAFVQGFFTSDSSSLPKDKQVTQEQILELLPWVTETNAISEELNKYRSFDVVVLSTCNNKEDKVVVQMTNLLNGNVWLWEKGKFVNRRYLMQDLYQAMLEGDIDIQQIPIEEDPFWEPVEDAVIGTASIFLQSLSYVLDFEDHLTITNFKGQEEGSLTVSILPCSSTGRLLGEDSYVERPQELIGRPYNFKVVIRNAEIKNSRLCKGIYIVYSTLCDDSQLTRTSTIKESHTLEFNHSRLLSISSVAQEHLDFFETGCITFYVYGIQDDKILNTKFKKMTTKELRQLGFLLQKPTLEQRNTVIAAEIDDFNQMKPNFVVKQKEHDVIRRKQERIQELCMEWDAKADEDKQFQPFFNAISAAASDTQLNSGVQGIAEVMDTGEDEDTFDNEVVRNGGYQNYEHLTNHLGGNIPALMESRKKSMQRRDSVIGTRLPTSNSGVTNYKQHSVVPQQTSRACMLQ